MSAVAGRLRGELREQFARLTFEERLALVLDLGKRDVEMYSSARCVDRSTAAEVIRAARRSGRHPSACAGHRLD
jgi:endonuclease V-like protein UPF0215 family